MPVPRRTPRSAPIAAAAAAGSGKAPTAREILLINLALKGGSAHDAFTWGVLDRLLEEEWLEIDGSPAPRRAP